MVQWIKSNFKVYTEVYFDTFLHYLPLSDDFKTSNLRAWHTVKRRSGLSVSATPNILATDLKDCNRMWLWVTWYTRYVCNQDMKTNFHPRGGGKLLPIHSLKWNPNDVLTTCKAISKGLASGFVYWSSALRQTIDQRSWEKNKHMAVEGGTVSHYYILVIHKFIDSMSLFRHSVWFSFAVKQFPFAEFGISNI